MSAAAVYFGLIGPLLYNEPGLETVRMLKNEELFTELPFAGDNPLAAEGQGQMAGWLAEGSAEALADQLKADYARLMAGVGRMPAPPWGSVYMDGDRLLFSEDTLHVRQYYERHGMKLKAKYAEPDDHIGLELEFLSYLLEQGKKEAAEDFVEKFVAPWIFRWNEYVQKHARSDFYRGLANMAAGGVQAL